MNRDGLAVVSAEPFPLGRRNIVELRTAAAECWRIVVRAALLVRAMDDDALAGMGFPRMALPAIRRSQRADAVVARFDFLHDGESYRAIECNADTPFLLLEAHRRCRAVLAAHGARDPNAGCETALGAAYASALYEAAPGDGTASAVTAYDAAEDRETARYLQEIVTPHLGRSLRFAPLRELRATADGLFDNVGRIDALLRLYPLEHFAADRGGAAFFSLLEREMLRIVNPPSALVAQNKLLGVPIWHLAQRSEYFSAEERIVIERRFLPAFAERPAKNGAWFVKPALGREGIGVYEDDGREPAGINVWQRKVAGPPCRHGGVDGTLVASCFVVAGEPGAVIARLGGPVTDATALVLAVTD